MPEKLYKLYDHKICSMQYKYLEKVDVFKIILKFFVTNYILKSRVGNTILSIVFKSVEIKMLRALIWNATPPTLEYTNFGISHFEVERSYSKKIGILEQIKKKAQTEWF